ncbi:hypothetical protein SLITO_v1c01950 [Spiroplasma litorale]|uniref:Carbohydrate kinase PfkB domain-containing protein n=1 Tax=Spiroplasma litorale TaxID=216942 RepID=A0A0K1W0M6_9MOLU|nr:PfkB family carbohydrate kinase [Spiroplasma litorale]AKX33859.1 hypothetical protein SLITO_v1c01950 [Spiroplasma litorale]
MKILVIGSALYQINLKVNNLPELGGQVRTNHEEKTIGGCAYNVAKIVKKYNNSIELFIPIGNGNISKLIKKEVKKLRSKLVLKDCKSDNGYCLNLITPNGERTFITKNGVENTIEEKWFKKVDKNYDCIYFDGYKLLNDKSKYLIDYLKRKKIQEFIFL